MNFVQIEKSTQFTIQLAPSTDYLIAATAVDTAANGAFKVWGRERVPMRRKKLIKVIPKVSRNIGGDSS